MKNYGPQGYPDNWESSCLWDGKVSVHFGYPEHGWVLLSVLTTSYNGSLVLQLSDAFDPFWDLIDWLKAVAGNNLPASFKIDEEGCYKELIVRPYSGRYSEYSDIEFRINGNRWNNETSEWEEQCFFIHRGKRVQFLDEFTKRLSQWLEEDYSPDGWNRSWREDDPDNPFCDLKNLDIRGLKQLIEVNKAADLTRLR
jgi:hypothetical protein